MNDIQNTQISNSVRKGQSKWQIILLYCSLLFNVVLAGFILYHVLADPMPKPKYPPPRPDINREHFREKQIEIRALRREFMESKLRFMESLASPDYDEQDLSSELEILLEKQLEMERAIAENLIEMRKRMDDDQAESFFMKLPDRIRDRKETLQIRR